MNITRRIAIRNLMLVTAGTLLLPSCLEGSASIKLINIDIDAGKEGILAALTDAIIPKTDTPGAKDISAHLFALKMVDDCYTKDEQKAFMQGFEEFNRMVENKYNSSFSKLQAPQQEELLSQLEKGNDVPEAIKSFYSSTKRLTILGYTTSKYFLSEVKHFSLLPGKYQGAVPVNSSKASV